MFKIGDRVINRWDHPPREDTIVVVKENSYLDGGGYIYQLHNEGVDWYHEKWLDLKDKEDEGG